MTRCADLAADGGQMGSKSGFVGLAIPAAAVCCIGIFEGCRRTNRIRQSARNCEIDRDERQTPC